jgi:hypothetical protein
MALGSNSADNNSMWPRLASRGHHDRFYTGQDGTVTRYRQLLYWPGWYSDQVQTARCHVAAYSTAFLQILTSSSASLTYPHVHIFQFLLIILLYYDMHVVQTVTWLMCIPVIIGSDVFSCRQNSGKIFRWYISILNSQKYNYSVFKVYFTIYAYSAGVAQSVQRLSYELKATDFETL